MTTTTTRVVELTQHIKDPVERARKQRNLQRAFDLVDKTPEEILAADDGRLDGVPLVDIRAMDKRENDRLDSLKLKRAVIFDLSDEPVKVKVETEMDILNKPGLYGYTPLIKAVVDQDYAKMEELLKKGVDINRKDTGGMTALEKALQAKDQQAVALLRQYGA